MNILITGGTGSLGSALIADLVTKGYSVTSISRDDRKQNEMREKFPSVNFYALNIGDASSYQQMVFISQMQDICIHTAAMKIVAEAEYQPFAYFNTNCMGTLYLLQAWQKTHGDCRQFLYINSDKAVDPLTTYGLTKALAGALARAEGYDASVLRYGNVVGSNGSFLSAWKRQVDLGNPIKVKQGQPSGEFPTRFFLTMPGAVDLVEAAITLMNKGEGGVFLPPNLPAFSVMDVADATELPYQIVGIEPAEKLHEILLARGEGWEATDSPLLVRRVLCYWERTEYYKPFSSDTAPRMAGSAVLEALKWKIE